MKVLMMHRNDGLAGGAQIQMNRLLAGLRAEGADAGILCRDSAGGGTVAIPRRPLAERVLGAATRRLGLNDIHLLGSHSLAGVPEVAAADVIDIHCLHSGTFSYLALPALAAARPVVFTFHDMWPITGHCHASLECPRWRSGCGNCPHLEIEPAVARDATAWEWRLKRRAFGRADFTIVTPSRWLADRVSESMLAGREVRHIPHGVDLEVFRPRDRSACREALGLPIEGTVMLCAIEHMDRPLKGAGLFLEALERIPEAERGNCTLLCFGKSSRALLARMPLPVVDLGYLSHDRIKALAYAAADFVVNPSLAECFGLVALEAMACGTPVVAFGVGGLKELVLPMKTGLLAEAGDAEDLSRRIREMLSDAAFRTTAGEAARRFVEAGHDIKRQVRGTMEVYRERMDRFAKRQKVRIS
jgi:glycosyltransferase involved in cell wall biosynthesis